MQRKKEEDKKQRERVFFGLERKDFRRTHTVPKPFNFASTRRTEQQIRREQELREREMKECTFRPRRFDDDNFDHDNYDDDMLSRDRVGVMVFACCTIMMMMMITSTMTRIKRFPIYFIFILNFINLSHTSNVLDIASALDLLILLRSSIVIIQTHHRPHHHHHHQAKEETPHPNHHPQQQQLDLHANQDRIRIV